MFFFALPHARSMKASVILLAFACAASAHANVKLPALFSDHMVVQADASVPGWGWAEPGEEVAVSLANQSKTTKAGADRRWKMTLENLKSGDQPQTLIVKGKNTLTVNDVLVGEVWLGSGQSNMAYKVASSNVAPQTIAEAKARAASVRPSIRFFILALTVKGETAQLRHLALHELKSIWPDAP
jgi:hypothetical protein